jgi:DHA1 family bicyclomycin/chloramphenicol resistance-like MFS transporter
MVGCLLSLASMNFPMMLAGRMIQGLGLAGPRVVAMAIIRDQYEGRAMARVMSFIMAVFIIVPAIAPALGQVILAVTGWRAIFGVFLSLALAVLIWFALRQPETLAPQHRVRFSLSRAGMVFREICSNRAALGYTVAAGFIFGAFQGYLNSAQQLIQIQYQRGNWSPLYYAVLAFSVGIASLINSRLVMRYGMRWLTRRSSQYLGGLSFLFLAIAFLLHGHPPLWALMTYLILTFFCLGLLFGNLNALAMRPLGHIAGSGAAMVGSFSILLAVPLGIAIGQAYNGTVLPLVCGFALLGTASAVVIRKSEPQNPTNPG